MDFLIQVSVYLMVGILVLKAYKSFFPKDWNYDCWLWEDTEENVGYDPNKKYDPGTGLVWFFIVLYPIVIFVKFTTSRIVMKEGNNMSDLLSELKNLLPQIDPGGDGWFAYQEIERLLKKYGWHPVSEPPEKSGMYLVTVNDGYDDLSVDIGNYDPLHYIGDHWSSENTLAWMLMPEPYKTEE